MRHQFAGPAELIDGQSIPDVDIEPVRDLLVQILFRRRNAHARGNTEGGIDIGAGEIDFTAIGLDFQQQAAVDHVLRTNGGDPDR